MRDRTSLDVKRADFKLDMLPPHLFMNLRVVDEHGRQLGMGRNLGALEGGAGRAGARGLPGAGGTQRQGRAAASGSCRAVMVRARKSGKPDVSAASAHLAGRPALHGVDFRRTAGVDGGTARFAVADRLPRAGRRRRCGEIEVFDEPAVAAAKHRNGLRRLFALQIKDALKYLEKNIPDLQKMAVTYMALGTSEELRAQIIDVALDRAFLQDPLPTDETGFKRRVEEGRGRLTLIANEVARLAGVILAEYAVAARKIKDTKNQPTATADAAQQLQRLVGKRFIADTPWPRLQHFARYLKAITLRLDKLRGDPARDAQRLAELRPQEQRYWRLFAERKGAVDERMGEFRWLLEELRVSFFAQELRTPQPVSVKRLDKLWVQLES